MNRLTTPLSIPFQIQYAASQAVHFELTKLTKPTPLGRPSQAYPFDGPVYHLSVKEGENHHKCSVSPYSDESINCAIIHKIRIKISKLEDWVCPLRKNCTSII
jgi:hypothetical protein